MADRTDVIRKRETEAGGCSACGASLSQWETGFPIDLMVEAVLLGPHLLEPLLVRRCRNCATRYDWDVLITAGDDLDRARLETEKLQAGLLEALRSMLRTPGRQPGEAAKLISGQFGVTGIYVEDGSEVARQLRRLLDG